MANLDINAAPNVSSIVDQPMTQASDFGASMLEQAGADVKSAGMQLAEARIRVDNRRDTINRSRLKNQFSDEVEAEYQRRLAESDLTDPAQSEDFMAWTNNKAMEMLGTHEGSQESVGKLTLKFDDIRASYTRQYSRDIITAGQKYVMEDMDKEGNQIIQDVGITGDLDLAFDLSESLVADNADVLKPQQERAKVLQYQQAAVKAAFDKAMADLNYDGAAKVLADPKVIEVMDPKEYRSLKATHTKALHAEGKGAREANQKLAEIAHYDGISIEEARRKYGPALAKKAAGTQKTRQTLAEKIQDYEVQKAEALGAPSYKATPEEVDKISGAYIKSAEGNMRRDEKIAQVESIVGEMTPETMMELNDAIHDEEMEPAKRLGAFKAVYPDMTPEQAKDILSLSFKDPSDDGEGGGSTIKERQMDIVNNLVDRFATGDLDPQEDKKFRGAIAILTTGGSHQDPDTGEIIVIPGMAMPRYVTEAYTRRGETIPVPAASAAGGDLGTGSQGGATDIDAPDPQETIFGASGLVPGVESAAVAGGARLPFGIGQFVADNSPIDAAAVQSARAKVKLMVNELVTALSKSPKLAEAERMRVLESIDLDPSLIDNVGAYRSRIYAIDDVLRSVNEDAQKILNLPRGRTTRNERRRAMEVYNRSEIFLDRLGAPPVLSSPEKAAKEAEALGLQDGDMFRVQTPSGGYQLRTWGGKKEQE